MKFKLTVSNGLCGCDRTGEFEVEDDALKGLHGEDLDARIYEAALDEAWNSGFIEISWAPIEEQENL